jgi:DNA-binding PadR family transcriptional regulator
MARTRLSPQTSAVLEALAADRGRWRHGYDVLRATGLKSGSLYPILMRLDERGWLEAAWEEDAPVGRPRRHLYRLTPAGAQALEADRKSADRVTEGRVRRERASAAKSQPGPIGGVG